MTRVYRALLLDLFGTVVHFRTPPAGAGGPAFEWLRQPVAAAARGLRFADFAAALRDVSREIAAGRAPEHREVPSQQRFHRVLARLDPSGAHDAAATALSAAHMAHLAAQTELPAGYDRLLGELAGRHRIALVSNFDHGPTARAILARHRIAVPFAAIVISAEHGRRKPHPAIFAAALERIAVAPGDSLYVGDTHEDDVVGALAAGLDVAWINRRGIPVPDPAPTYVLGALTDLRSLLG